MKGADFSPNFQLWARKTEHISDGGFRRGFDRLEYLVQEAGREGKEAWPPTYAEFVGYCESPAGSKMYKEYEPIKALPEPIEVVSKRKQAGMDALNNMKDMFDE